MIYLLRTIPLSKRSREAWKSGGVTIIPRSTVSSLSLLHDYLLPRTSEDTLINLGRSDNALGSLLGSLDINVVNHPDSVRLVKTPRALRDTLKELVPPFPKDGEQYWHKGPGQHGKNKVIGTYMGNSPHFKKMPGWDFQKHIEGTEYRVISVNKRVVQAFRKEKNEAAKYGFDYTWVGVAGIKSANIIPKIHKAIDCFPSGVRTLFGWDCIVDSSNVGYIIEANSSPGMSDVTVKRIVKELNNDAAAV